MTNTLDIVTTMENNTLGEGKNISVGSITNSNPTLWLDPATLGQDKIDYVISTKIPAKGWFYVTQFCSILSLKWLESDHSASSFQLSDFSDSDKVAMAENLIEDFSMQGQINHAKTELNGQQKSLDQVAIGVQDHTQYQSGTKIWAANNSHVIAIYLDSDSQFSLYDPDTGLVDKHHPRSMFQVLMESLGCDTFVVSSPNSSLFSENNSSISRPMVGDNTVELSTYIVAFAGAARAAQAVMSTGTDPMTIKEYTFKINITADQQVTSTTDVGLDIWRMTLKEKLVLDYKEHMGIDINCTIVPAATLTQQ